MENEYRSNEYHDKPELKWVESISRIMDSKFTIPGTKFRFGADPLIGLIPGLGDAASFAVSGILVYTMAKYGVSRKVLILMMLNIMLDAFLGAIPFVGNIFDFFYKANSKNIRLLKEHYIEGKHEGSGTGILVFIVITFLVMLIGIVYGLYKLFEFLFGLF
jgi:hypothetical protein